MFYTRVCLRGGYTHRARYLRQGRSLPALFLYRNRYPRPAVQFSFKTGGDNRTARKHS